VMVIIKSPGTRNSTSRMSEPQGLPLTMFQSTPKTPGEIAQVGERLVEQFPLSTSEPCVRLVSVTTSSTQGYGSSISKIAEGGSLTSMGSMVACVDAQGFTASILTSNALE